MISKLQTLKISPAAEEARSQGTLGLVISPAPDVFQEATDVKAVSVDLPLQGPGTRAVSQSRAH